MISVSKILLPVAFSERCRGAARYAEALARHFQTEPVLLHVVTPPYPLYGGPEAAAYSSAADVFAQRLTQSKADLEAFLGDALHDLRVQRIVLEGDPAHKIVEYAHTEKFDLIVMPTHGYGPFRRFLLGSVTAKLLHDADCPVWTGPHMEGAPAFDAIRFHRIVCALDLSPQSRVALEWAAGMAQEFGAHLYVIHAIPSSEIRLEGVYFDPAWRIQLAKAARQQISGLLEDLRASGEVHIETGDVPAAVSQAAQRMQADLLVIGRSHHSGVLGRLRTNAYAIIRESPCPVASI